MSDNYNLSNADYMRYYKEIFDKIEKIFNNNFFLESMIDLGVVKKSQKEEIIQKTNKTLQNIDSMIYEDAYELLGLIKENNYSMILLTYGNYEWQKAKTANLSITKMFDEIIITSENKKTHICAP